MIRDENNSKNGLRAALMGVSYTADLVIRSRGKKKIKKITRRLTGIILNRGENRQRRHNNIGVRRLR